MEPPAKTSTGTKISLIVGSLLIVIVLVVAYFSHYSLAWANGPDIWGRILLAIVVLGSLLIGNGVRLQVPDRLTSIGVGLLVTGGAFAAYYAILLIFFILSTK